jgi:cell division protein FtsN
VSDEGFREIQLNGKQLIFLFMAATVFSVVVFLIGVMVGRNARLGTEPAEAVATEIAPDAIAPATPEPVAPAPPATAPADAPAAKPTEELSYADRLLRDTPPEEHLKPQPPPPAPPREVPAPPREAPAAREAATSSAPPRDAVSPPAPTAAQEPVASKPTPRPAPATPPPAAADIAAAKAAVSTDPSGPGFAVQVAAYRDRRESDSLAKQLIAKGYPAFVMDPVKGAPTAFFRVRVGNYKTLKDAQAIMSQLQSAEQFNNAWIAR